MDFTLYFLIASLVIFVMTILLKKGLFTSIPLSGIIHSYINRQDARKSPYRDRYCFCSRGKCIGIMLARNAHCFTFQNMYNELRVFIKAGKISGLLLLLSPYEMSKALNKIETRLIELKIILERRPDNYSIKRKIEILESMANSIKMGRLPLTASLGIFYKANTVRECHTLMREIQSLLDRYNCEAHKIPVTSILELLTKPSSYLASEDASFKLIDTLEEFLKPPYKDYSVPLGLEIDSGSLVFLPLWDKGSLHSLALGPTGKGKTTLLATIATRVSALYKDLVVIAVDPKGDFANRLDTINKFTIDNSIIAPLLHVAYNDGFIHVYHLGLMLGINSDKDLLNLAFLLKNCHINKSDPEIASLLAMLEAYGVNIDTCSWKPLLAKAENLVKSIGRESMALDLSYLSDSLKNIVLWALLTIIVERLASEPASSPKAVLLVDEAWRLSAAPRHIMRRLFKEGRSYGISVIMASQDPEDIADEIWNNISTVIVFGSQDKEYVRKIKRILKLSDADTAKIAKLRRGEAYIRLPGALSPIFTYIQPETREMRSNNEKNTINKTGKMIVKEELAENL